MTQVHMTLYVFPEKQLISEMFVNRRVLYFLLEPGAGKYNH